MKPKRRTPMEALDEIIRVATEAKKRLRPSELCIAVGCNRRLWQPNSVCGPCVHRALKADGKAAGNKA